MTSTLLEGAAPGLILAALLLMILPWIDRNSHWRILPIAIAQIFTIRYVYWRATETIPSMDNLTDFAAGWLFFAIELSALGASFLSYITLTRTRNRSPEVDANLPWLQAKEHMPLVDVFICTYNEGREILERTMIGAKAMEYPNYRVWVLDDGRRDWLRELAADYDCNYLARADNAHAKAGNINNALTHVRGLDEPPDFISILDADFVTTPVFLTRALTLFHEDDVGIVQTPQHFMNPDPIQANLRTSDAWPDEQRYFFDVLMPAKDAWGTAFCCGTSSVIRMDALDTIGFFPTDSVTEDYLLTLRMQRNGYRTVFLNEPLSFGLAPEGLQEYITQRSRWCLGFFQIVRGVDGPFRFGNGLRRIDRVALIETMLFWFGANLFRVAGLVVPILYLLLGIQAVAIDTTEGIANFLPFYFAHMAVMGWLSNRRVLPIMTDLSQLLAVREILTAAFVGILWPKGRKFKVTAKGGDRSKTVVQWRMLTMFSTLLVLTVLGIAVTFGGNKAVPDSSAVALYWSWYNILILIAAIAVCIEKPRQRRDDRMLGGEPVTVASGSHVATFRTADISTGGMRLLGTIQASVGDPVSIRIRSDILRGRIVRRSQEEFAIQLDETLRARATMIRLVYSGGFSAHIGEIRILTVARRLLQRLSA
ncbi:glycosyltransferase [Oricola thermophila]|uniref:cellulose synthase (UDP-forming) n=2 Tax=Oricola thermophila TaxID=2742145 RepID=A0A6N1VI34_9HYPH|nr:glycosyltransferase [Oricola thermophila]